MKIALIAHDKKKEEIIEFVKEFESTFANHELFATGTTGLMIMGDTALQIKRMKSGPLGGDQEMGALVANHKMDLVFFFRDPLTSQPHEPDISALMRLCDVYKVPLATNSATARLMVHSL